MNVVLAVLVAPIILAVVNHWLGRASKREDWRRADEVAEAARQVTTALAESDSNRAEMVAQVAEVAQATDHKLDVIHELVNSQMTARMMSELNAKKATLAALVGQRATLRRLLASETGTPPPTDVEALAVLDAGIESTDAEVRELNAAAVDRLTAHRDVPYSSPKADR